MVLDDPRLAQELAAAGESVVLIVDGPSVPVPVGSSGPGRIAVLVGSGDDPAVRAAAQEMDRELFGAEGTSGGQAAGGS